MESYSKEALRKKSIDNLKLDTAKTVTISALKNASKVLRKKVCQRLSYIQKFSEKENEEKAVSVFLKQIDCFIQNDLKSFDEDVRGNYSIEISSDSSDTVLNFDYVTKAAKAIKKYSDVVEVNLDKGCKNQMQRNLLSLDRDIYIMYATNLHKLVLNTMEENPEIDFLDISFWGNIADFSTVQIIGESDSEWICSHFNNFKSIRVSQIDNIAPKGFTFNRKGEYLENRINQFTLKVSKTEKVFPFQTHINEALEIFNKEIAKLED